LAISIALKSAGRVGDHADSRGAAPSRSRHRCIARSLLPCHRKRPSTSTNSEPTPIEHRPSAGCASIVLECSASASQRPRGSGTVPPGGSHFSLYSSLSPAAVRKTRLRSALLSLAPQESGATAMSTARQAAAQRHGLKVSLRRERNGPRPSSACPRRASITRSA
jgi:hypothetical protein